MSHVLSGHQYSKEKGHILRKVNVHTKIPGWSEERVYLSGTQGFGAESSQGLQGEAADLEKVCGMSHKGEDASGPSRQFENTLQIPKHSCHQKVRFLPVLSLRLLLWATL